MSETPRIAGLEPTFTNVDDGDIPFIAVRSQRNADGSESHVWEKWVAFSADPLYLALFARWDPGMIVRHHGHYSPHTLTVLSGSFTCGDVELGPGGHIELPLGASFGPFVAGPEGVELYEVMMGDPRSWSDDMDSMARWLSDRGVQQLPDPPIELPAGLEDLRAAFSKGVESSKGVEKLCGRGELMAMSDRKIVTVLKPEDEYPHVPDPVSNYNESMYLNGFDLQRELGAWFRIGNRVNEGYAEMTVCIYLPDGRIGFLYGRPEISSNDEMNAGGLEIKVIEPFEHLQINYDGKVCLLDEPRQMATPRVAFRDNPFVDCSVRLDVTGVSPMYGGMPQYEDGSPVETDSSASFAKAHYEQHTAVVGTIQVGEETIALDGLGLRDKSWGPRYWQALRWYRWLPMIFGPDFAMMLSIVDRDGTPARSGMVLADGEYQQIRDCTIESEWDLDDYQTAMRCWAATDNDTYEITGRVLSMIPLRNRRTTDDGRQLHTRITEAMTRYECNGRVGMGMSEYLDQIVDGRPIGTDMR